MNYFTATSTAVFRGALENLFDSFQKDITVFKEPIRIVSTVTAPTMAGYAIQSREDNVTYEPVSQTFSAMIYTKLDKTMQDLVEIQTRVGKDGVWVKVEEDAKTFIEQGETKYVDVLGRSYIPHPEFLPKKFMGLTYWWIFLTNVN